MVTRSAVFGIALLLALVAPRLSAAQVDCSNPDNLCTGDPCVIGSITVASACAVSFGPRAVVVAGSLRVPSGGTLALSAGAITVDGGIATSQADGGTDGADVTLTASDGVVVNGTIRTTAADSSGDITITAGGDVELAGRLRTATAPEAYPPGNVAVQAGGVLRVGAPIVTKGKVPYSIAGSITLRGDGGVFVERPLDASAGKGINADNGGDVDISS